MILWSASSPRKLSSVARELLTESNNLRIISSVSIWEMCVKHAKGKLPLPRPPAEFVDLVKAELLTTYLAFDSAHALTMCSLPQIHHDPFDRMLVCQAMVHDLTILTPDPEIHRYPIKAVW